MARKETKMTDSANQSNQKNRKNLFQKSRQLYVEIM